MDGAKRACHDLRGDRKALERLLDASGGALEGAVAALDAVDERPTGPYLERYSGLVFRTLRGESWSDELAVRGQRQIAVVSALWGLVWGRDAVPDARLNIAASVADLGGLATFWRGHLHRVLDPVAEVRVIVDLRSSGYDRTWSPSDDARGVVTVRFLRPDGRRAEPSALGKQRKGALARHLLDAALPDDASLADVLAVAAESSAATRFDPTRSALEGDRPQLTFVATA